MLILFCACSQSEKSDIAVQKKSDPKKKQTICLNMIVKNESAVIQRCLDSVKPYIDSWIIVDTGSNDGTQDIIKKHLKDIPGKLYERPWKNFGANRSEAFELAKGKADYILFMDADDWLEPVPNFQFPLLTTDVCHLWRGPKGFTYIKPQLAKASLPWKWVGVTHEYLDCGQQYTAQTLDQLRYITGDDGASRADLKKKYKRNVQILKTALKEEPNNERYVFYIAESYYDAGLKGQSLEWYQKRIAMGGWHEEVFWSMLRIGHISRDLGLPLNCVAECYLRAHNFRPHRPEAIYFLAEEYNRVGQYELAYKYLKQQLSIPKPLQKDWLFNMDWIDDYGLMLQLAVSSYYLGNYEESVNYCNSIITKENLPQGISQLAASNRTFALNQIELKKSRPKKK